MLHDFEQFLHGWCSGWSPPAKCCKILTWDKMQCSPIQRKWKNLPHCQLQNVCQLLINCKKWLKTICAQWWINDIISHVINPSLSNVTQGNCTHVLHQKPPLALAKWFRWGNVRQTPELDLLGSLNPEQLNAETKSRVLDYRCTYLCNWVVYLHFCPGLTFSCHKSLSLYTGVVCTSGINIKSRYLRNLLSFPRGWIFYIYIF